MNLLVLVVASMAAGGLITTLIWMLRLPRLEAKWRRHHEDFVRAEDRSARAASELRTRRLE